MNWGSQRCRCQIWVAVCVSRLLHRVSRLSDNLTRGDNFKVSMMKILLLIGFLVWCTEGWWKSFLFYHIIVKLVHRRWLLAGCASSWIVLYRFSLPTMSTENVWLMMALPKIYIFLFHCYLNDVWYHNFLVITCGPVNY